MAELVDASDSKSGISNDVQVRFLFWAQDPAVMRDFFLGTSWNKFHFLLPEIIRQNAWYKPD